MTSATKNAASPKTTGPDGLESFVPWVLGRHARHGGVTEVRIIADRPCKLVWSGFFDAEHGDALIDLLRPVPGGPRPKVPFGEHARIGEANVYFTLHPVCPDLLARSANEFVRGIPTTSDADILAYDLFFIDVDPVRPSGISATDEETREAQSVALKILRFLLKRRVVAVDAFSGNGYHLLVPTVPYPDVAEAAEKAKALLKMLDAMFSTEKAKVDCTVFNPARICKLYGSKSMKGSDLPQRPHRFSYIFLKHVCEDVDLFAALAADLDAFRAESAPSPAPAPPAEPPVGGAAPRFAPAARGGWGAKTSAAVLRGVLERSGLDFREKAKAAGLMFEFQDCPHHTDPDGDHYECCVIVRPDGSYAAKCQHEADAGWQDFKKLIGWDEHAAAVREGLGLPSQSVPYRATPSGLVWLKPTGEGDVVPIPLTNFDARIVTNVVEDDGAEKRTVFEVEADLRGRKSSVMVPAPEFSGMSWVLEHLGAQAVVRAGFGTRDHARAAIQLLSTDVSNQLIFTHTGWRAIDGRPVYLHAGGAIGADGAVPGVRVSLSGPFANFHLPEPPSGVELTRAVCMSYRLLRAAPPVVTVPLLAAVYRAALGTADFSLHLAGPTGAAKSTRAILAQQHFGAGLNAQHIPGSWSSTANALEAMAFTAKDALFLLDDFAPGSSLSETNRLHRDADRLFRGQGNGTGRSRMRPDSSLRPTKSPRGLILSTGEDIPRGQSLRARLLLIELSPGAVDWDKVTKRQGDAADGLFAASMAGYIRWLAGRYDEWQKEMPQRIRELRDAASNSAHHKRTPFIIANLFYALELFGEFAVEVGALTADSEATFRDRCWAALGKVASAQAALQNTSEPARRFLDLLTAAVAAGKAHVAGHDGKAPPGAEGWGWRKDEPRGDRIGWLEGTHLYLEPEAAYAVAQRLGADSGEPLAVTSRVLHRRRKEQGWLAATDEARERFTVRRVLDGKQRDVLYLRAEALGAIHSS